MTSKPKIGFIGVGLMGHGMAKNIVAKGWELSVIAHRNRKPVESLVEAGAREAASLAELAQSSDIVFLCVTSSVEVEQVVLGDDGLIANGARGMVIVDTSTSHPESTAQVNAKAREAGMLFCDAPLSRSPARAEEGKLVSLIAAEKELYERIKPVVAAYSEIIIHAGEDVGMAHQVKLMNNFIAMGYAAVWAEGYATCLAAGIDPKVLHEFVSSSGLDCLNFQNFSKFVLSGDGAGHKFAIANCEKDLRYYTSYVDSMKLGSAVADNVYNTYKLAVRRGFGDKFVPELTAAVMDSYGIKRNG